VGWGVWVRRKGGCGRHWRCPWTQNFHLTTAQVVAVKRHPHMHTATHCRTLTRTHTARQTGGEKGPWDWDAWTLAVCPAWPAFKQKPLTEKPMGLTLPLDSPIAVLAVPYILSVVFVFTRFFLLSFLLVTLRFYICSTHRYAHTHTLTSPHAVVTVTRTCCRYSLYLRN